MSDGVLSLDVEYIIKLVDTASHCLVEIASQSFIRAPGSIIYIDQRNAANGSRRCELHLFNRCELVALNENDQVDAGPTDVKKARRDVPGKLRCEGISV